MSTSFEAESHKDPDTLEQEIDAKRASISHIVDSLESRFTPGQLFDQALAYTKGNGGEFFQNLGTTLKNNPVPTVLTGVGLAWLAMNQNRPFSPGPAAHGPGLGDRLSSAVGQVSEAFNHLGERVHDATDATKAKARDLKDKAGDITHAATDSFGNATHGAGNQAQALKGQFDHLLKDQPLVLAAIGIALGAALGAALPPTRKEDELMGSTRDDLTRQLKTKAQETYDEVKETVKGAGKVEDAKPADLSAGLGMNP